ncbi:outer membrane protein [Limimaricola pyoseonensis]|uniref:Opacity protein n=1 Tax=Limimaricola pyoseonensis TaxID=521013 RepID=A0A1G6ZVL6_9RHOB|nr:outer membrane beta-barrel protein [Limimaricola pyoseonensis]SDE06383.1 Opacity protein [Limimaricola pyoseonensis]
MKFSTSSLAIALGLVAAPAFAGGLAEPVADPVVPAAPVAVAPVVTGSDWTGGYVGAQLGYGQAETDDDPASFDEDGAIYGAQAGYNYDFGSFVLGGELDFTGTELGNDLTDIDGIARAKVRAGYDAGAFLPYLTAGYASAYTSEEIDGDDQFDGYLYGAGVDYAVSENIVVGAEVLQHEFEDVGAVDLDATTAAARVNYKF